MESSWAAIRSIRVWCEVESRSHELIALYALASVQLALMIFACTSSGFVSYMPVVRCLAARDSDGPWMYRIDPPLGKSAPNWRP